VATPTISEIVATTSRTNRERSYAAAEATPAASASALLISIS
jgi:hypothetical protein